MAMKSIALVTEELNEGKQWPKDCVEAMKVDVTTLTTS